MSPIRIIRPTLISLLSLAACLVQPMQGHSERLSADQAQADLQRLYSGLVAAEANLFAATPKFVFDTHFETLKAKYDGPVSRSELHADLQRFAALARHGHTRIEGANPGWAPYLDAGGSVFPLSLRIENGEVIVAGAPADGLLRPGDRILALNGDANPIWLRRFTQHISAETPALAYALMAGNEAYYAWLEYGARDTYDVEFSRDGQSKRIEIAATSYSALRDLQTLASGFELTGRAVKIPTDSIGYLRPGGFYNLEATTAEAYFDPQALTTYNAFIDDAFNQFIAQGVSDVILDLRDNPGGDNSYSDPVVAWFADRPFRFASEFRIRVSDETTASNQARLDAQDGGEDSISATFAALFKSAQNGDSVSFDLPYATPRDGQRFTGNVHVLVNRYSYSNAVSVAALIQDYGFGVTYGETTRDMATTYGAMEHFELEYSGFRVGYPKAHIIRPNGETESHPLTPDIRLPAPAIRGQADVRLDALIARLSQR